ncbi:MAG: hypothetical protein DLM61_22840 [Pseudonocardiales bacterium]|nr:MAG: hypothetical protein DLM61_22840 [Pseudonocardiales bacterium]
MSDGEEPSDVVGVGDIRMVRTFRVGADGGLYPVNSASAWTEGWNTATCARGRNHTPPDPSCRCDFYVYAHPSYAQAQAPARQVMAVVAVHGAMEAGSRGARAEQARVDAVWLGPRVSDDLADAVQRRYPSLLVYRDRAAMLTDLPLGSLPGFREPRISERGHGLIRVALLLFLAVVAVIGIVPTTIAIANAPRAALWLAALAGSAGITLTGLAVRSSMVTFVGITALAWMVTAESTTTLGGILYRCLVLLVAAWVGIVWLRAAQPGRVIREPRLEAALRRWRGQLPGSR